MKPVLPANLNELCITHTPAAIHQTFYPLEYIFGLFYVPEASNVIYEWRWWSWGIIMSYRECRTLRFIIKPCRYVATRTDLNDSAASTSRPKTPMTNVLFCTQTRPSSCQGGYSSKSSEERLHAGSAWHPTGKDRPETFAQQLSAACYCLNTSLTERNSFGSTTVGAFQQ